MSPLNINWTFVGGWVLSFDVFPWQVDSSEPNKSSSFKLLRICNFNCSLHLLFFHSQERTFVLPTITEGLEDPSSE